MANQGVEFSVADLSLFTHSFSISLGNGACGAVFRGEIPAENDYGLGQQKIAVKQFVVSDKAAQQWMTERNALAKFHDNPNIVTLVGYAQDAEHFYVVLEFAELGSLEQVYKDLDWPKTLQIMRSLGEAISALHVQEDPILHRDLKMANVLIAEGYQAMLGDFGEAACLSDRRKTSHNNICAGPFVPDIMGKEEDVYCFGAIMKELLGKRRFVYHDAIVVHSSLKKGGCKGDSENAMIQLVDKCTSALRSTRPNIGQILEILHAIETPPASKASSSCFPWFKWG